jgi:gliding motility-associated-like protein
LGQTPGTAFPVCGTATFHQSSVPVCGGTSVPGPCSGVDGVTLADLNPYWYQFTCFSSGTLAFKITPANLNDDYDWQLFDITGHNPNDVFTDISLFVACNWSGSTGITGASSAGTQANVCATTTAHPNQPLFSTMPTLQQGHTYILLVSHFSGNDQSGYDLSFGGGTAVITDPADPHLLSAKPDCDGQTIRVKLNKKMKCSSLTATGSEFSIIPAVATVVSAVATNCSSAFDFDEVTLTLSGTLPNGNYQLAIGNGTDGNSIKDACDRSIPVEQTPFFYAVPQPIFADSLSRSGCAPDSIRIYFPKRIVCSSISPSGSDFIVTPLTPGNPPVTVVSAWGDCATGLTDYITVKFSQPIYQRGTYQLTLTAGTDGSPVLDECNVQLPQQSLTFNTEDTVSARFTYAQQLDCRLNTVTFSHDGAHFVDSWNWTINQTITATTQTYTTIFPATSDNFIQLIVDNGVCRDTASLELVMNNEVKAAFGLPGIICPEDPLVVTDSSKGLIDTWLWNFGNVATSSAQNPPPQHFPQTNIETFYTIKLKVTNNTLGCTDSISKVLRVLNNCYIAVPTAFTPNGDGLNDYLYPNNAIKAVNLEFKVYNRWGQLVFASRNWEDKWDGKINGIPQAPGVFVWFLRYTNRDTGQKVFQKGTTTLIR